MATAQALVNFRKSYPVDFSLLDQHDQAVIYISEDKDDWELHLTIANTASQSISMIDGTGGTSSTNHHFALRFRPGTLAKRSIELLTGDKSKNVLKTADWELAKLLPPAPNAPVTLYLRYTGKNKVLKQNESHVIKLMGISAAPGTGSRGTQVELIPHQLKFEGEGGAAITNSRTQYLHVTNHSGRKNIPLHVGFVGGNGVINGAIDASLMLRITNVFKSKDARQSTTITFRGPNPQTDEAASELVLSYDKGQDEWELGELKPGTGSKAGVTAVNKKKGLNLIGKPGQQGDRPDWRMTFEKEFQLEYGESFDIEISGVVVSSQVGHANLYLHYNNIPGYWEGQFVCTVEKGPIIVHDSNVGIGTRPTSKLEVAGETKTRTLKVDGGSTLNTLKVDGGSTLNTLKVDGTSTLQALKLTARASAPTIQLGNGSLELGWDSQGDGSPNGGWIQTKGGSLVINDKGNLIEMGSRSPQSTVQINGHLIVKGQITSQYSVWLKITNHKWRPFTEVASMEDEDGFVHLRGVLFVPANALAGDYICCLNLNHVPNNDLPLKDVTGLRSLTEWSQHTLSVVGLNANPNIDPQGWIKVVDFLGERPKLISLDGLKFKR